VAAISRRNHKRSAILEAARHLLAAGSFDDLSVDSIARAAGLSKATFYTCFNSKEQLRQDLLAEGADPEALSATDNRAAILDAALKTFGERGYHATTLEEVASAAGVTKGAVYWYFKTKEALFGAVIERYSIFPDVAELAEGTGTEDDEEQLTALATKFLAIIQERINFVRMLMCESQHFPEAADVASQQLIGRIYPLFGKYLARRIQVGAFRPVNPLLATQTFISSLVMFGMATRTFARQFPFSNQEIVSEVVRLFLDGIRTADASSRSHSEREGIE
jgi:AcrR family transcriptional regulator